MVRQNLTLCSQICEMLLKKEGPGSYRAWLPSRRSGQSSPAPASTFPNPKAMQLTFVVCSPSINSCARASQASFGTVAWLGPMRPSSSALVFEWVSLPRPKVVQPGCTQGVLYGREAYQNGHAARSPGSGAKYTFPSYILQMWGQP